MSLPGNIVLRACRKFGIVFKGNVTTRYDAISITNTGMCGKTWWLPTECHIQTVIIKMKSLGMDVSTRINNFFFQFALKM